MTALSVFAITVQGVGTLLVAALLWQLTRIIPARFLAYWAVGWVALATALLSLRLAVQTEIDPAARQAGLIVFCLGEYLFAFLVWAGFRAYATGRPVGRADLLVLAPFLAFGLAAPLAFSSLNTLFPFHAPLVGVFFLLALWATRGAPRPADRPPVGLTVTRAALAVLAVLFLHYGPVLYRAVYVTGTEVGYLAPSALYDALAELGLAFGMVVLAAERVRDELEAKNRQLAAATRQLAEQARTDALTGLLNRRAFEQFAAEYAGAAYRGSLAVIDLNDLKRINDQFLHPAGDAALKVVARALRNRFRVTDPLFRVGGDEFVAVLANGTEADLTARMQSIDTDLAKQRVPGMPDQAALTIAWGVAAFDSADGLAQAYQKADQAMFTDKQRRKGEPPR